MEESDTEHNLFGDFNVTINLRRGEHFFGLVDFRVK